MGLRIVQVDAFTDTPFAGNPAAVCVLPTPREAQWMQHVAREMNLSETAFLCRRPDGFDLRWFTPAIEVPLCGHATLASAHVLWEDGHLPAGTPAHFHTRSGLLTATRQDGWISLDFPALPVEPAAAPEALVQALQVTPLYVGESRASGARYLVEVASEEIVRPVLDPDGRFGGRASGRRDALGLAAPADLGRSQRRPGRLDVGGLRDRPLGLHVRRARARRPRLHARPRAGR